MTKSFWISLFSFGAAAACMLLFVLSGNPSEQGVAEKAAAGFLPTFPLAVEPAWDTDGSGLWGFGFFIEVTPFNKELPPQLLMVDTGSSSLACCNKTLAIGQSKDIMTLPAKAIQCNSYGTGASYFWGYTYAAWVTIGPNNFVVTPASFVVMEEHVGMTCREDGFVMDATSLR
ncbi:hypothetical protein T492DRAFT_836277 [Pavlovales sp. CCMP2436]|nr:hypothetical protein T492DRAFT_836277 [Pavlovales sp. CCMP2436]